jgi:hypothetical protein
MEVMKAAGERHLWERQRDEEQRLKGDDEFALNNETPMEIDTIDWHDFVVVEKIDLYEDEEMKDEEDEEERRLREQEEKK